MVKIRISYEKPEELTEVLRRLHPVGNIRQQDKGRYKKADNEHDTRARVDFDMIICVYTM